jgi:hypothetical protein
MTPFAESIDATLTKLAGEAREQLEGVPERDLNEWKPALGLQDVNTFYALTTHLIGAGEYWVLHAAAGRPTDRNRAAEFIASGSLETLLARLDRWLTEVRGYLATLSEDDLGRYFERGGVDPLRRTVADCLIHAATHTAEHVGHLQIQRQIWNAEHGLPAAPAPE